MPVDSTQHQPLFQTLNLGSFPKDVLEFQDSQSYLRQIIFVDHQLQSCLPSVSPTTLYTVANGDVLSKIKRLTSQVNSINSNYAAIEKTYLEVYYSSVVLAHLHLLDQDYESVIATLNGFRIDHSVPLGTVAEREFLDYLSARFHSILGRASQNGPTIWTIFLESLERYGHKGQVSANIWIDSIFGGLLSALSSVGKKPIGFSDLRSQKFSKNVVAFVSMANYALRKEGEKFTTGSFKPEYQSFLSELLKEKIKQKKDFPNANEENSEDLYFVESFYQTLNSSSFNRFDIAKLVSPELSKKFLVNMTEKSYQNQSVLSNLIITLIDLGEYDEAFAAFKTYVSYVERERVQTGDVPDILQVITLYSLCISSFNPTKSFIPDANASFKKFKYNSLDTVVQELVKLAKTLQNYLEELAEIANLSYDDALYEKDQDPLSFLYHKYNPQVFVGNKSVLVGTSSEAWFSLGKLHTYLLIYNSPNSEILNENKAKVLLFHKNSLIVNSSGNLGYLFEYALSLAYDNNVTESSKLCKFILKKFPESFKTWNLLGLLASASDNRNFISNSKLSDVPSEEKLNKAQNENVDFLSHNGRTNKANESEKFIGDALNIASLYISKHRESNTSVSLQTKYEILQLKMSQLAVWEATYGVESILEFITEIFVLYRELFSHVQFPKPESQNGLGSRTEAKWSKRPSVMDPSDENGTRKASGSKNPAKETIKRLSKISIDNTDRKHANNRQEEQISKEDHKQELRILQDIWLWTASIYLRLGFLEEAEQCIVEAETADKPNVKTYTLLGFLTSKSRKHLALQEFERSFEILHSTEEKFNRKAYGLTLVGMSQLLITKDEETESLFVSEKDRDAGLVRLKNYLECYSNCWPYGHNSSEIWYYLSAIYEEFDDKLLQSEALWKCIDLETNRPVRSYDICEDFFI
ncbi:hypothetical protein JCM33374_g3979 [Metschnikowia sp. JCM 33374]|nr:hypothetical protein JCM33374_g3979 [Metschnikowia sp. JCM 33374]